MLTQPIRSGLVLLTLAAILPASPHLAHASAVLPAATSTRDCVRPPAGLVAWWPWDGTPADIQSLNSARLVNGATYSPGEVGRALQLDGVDGYAEATASSSLDVGLGDGLTVETWISPTQVSTWQPVVEWNNGQTYGVHLWIDVARAGGGPGSVFANIIDTRASGHELSSRPGLVIPNTWQHIAVTYDKMSGYAKLYLNGASVASSHLGTFTPQTSYDLYFGHRPNPPASPFGGLVDEAGIVNRALAPAEIAAIYRAGSNGKCRAPVFVSRITPGYMFVEGQYRVFATIELQDALGEVVPGAQITTQLTQPDGSQITWSDTTSEQGTLQARQVVTLTGTYTFTVVSVRKPGRSYAPDHNLETSDSVTIP